MTRWLAAAPLAGLALFAIIAAINLGGPRSDAPLADGRPAPARVFERLDGAGEVAFNPPPAAPMVVNLFASWCAPCRAEHPLLMALGEAAPAQLAGVLYKDDPAAGAAFLDELGDPFAVVGIDPDGQGGLDFGLTGVPETFVISAEGQVIRHFRGPLTRDDAAEIAALVAGG